MFFELTYSSKAISNLSQQDVLLIQSKSAEYNLQNGITGCLVLHNQEFVAILEGEKSKVIELFSKIKEDGKHGEAVLLASGSIYERQFEQWNMIFQINGDDGKVGKTKQLFIDNLVGLTQLVEKHTYASRVFWDSVTELLEKNNVHNSQKKR